MSHKYALDIVLETLNALLETLNVIQLSEGPSDRKAVSEVSESLSNFLQSPDFELFAALSMITKNCHLQNLRREDGFNSISKFHEYAAKNCNIEFVPLQEKHMKRHEKMFRSEYIQFAESSSFSKNISLPTFLYASESDSENSNISSEEEKRIEGTCLVGIYWKNKLQDVFSNLYIMVKIALSLPVDGAIIERYFSKLKIIKNRLRSTMAGEQLKNFMKISCENDIDIDYDNILNIFSSKNPGLLKLLTI
ncbi:hypothetical protein AGLY_002211 [Aphis glycines]|uniref:HAT C-terminal dimerisation domain-containing protein n=1 Tax=Aphis glycines TaxID=307491 RepID=A0A6G0U2R7_APHGL|nr:hypothetical protein AGLY_002211 [Aphis glycines]